MAEQTTDKWAAWNEERKLFQARESEGFESDLKALEEHISWLIKAAPKDKANWPYIRCLEVINQLKRERDRAKVYFGKMS